MTSPAVNLLAVVCLVLCLTFDVKGHGRLIDPPGRSTAWRYNFNTEINYNDNELNCGGFHHQWGVNGGACGVCGDRAEGPYDHEAGGKYASGTIVRSFSKGATIDVSVQITANHLGWFEFRLCSNNDVNSPITQECLDEHLLPLADGSGTRLPITGGLFDVSLQLVLPENLICSQCVLQWKYNAGNSWGTDEGEQTGCVGCGPQEQFYGCADIRITGNGDDGDSTQTTTQPPTTTTQPPTTTTQPPAASTQPPAAANQPPAATTQPPPVTTPSAQPETGCRAAGPWTGSASMTAWCVANCAAGYCPASHCTCD